MTFDAAAFAEKYWLALEAAQKENPSGGLNGFEIEWNLLDEQLRPLLTVGSGPAKQSFVDYLRLECLPPYLARFSQLEVFHWMIEWATRAHFTSQAAVYEARLMEAVLINALARAGGQFGKHLYYWHGNLLYLTGISQNSIPETWGIAKRRYLERCVDLYGDTLATAGTHTNLSLPEPLLAWDFMHLPARERGDRHLDQYKSEFYITASRLMRAFTSVFIATSASTPLQAQMRQGIPVVILTENDSVRNLTFPNPSEIDLPDLYRSYDDYLKLSYDLVRRGVRFGNNNWTPVRARSFAEPVERLISTTSDQLSELYARGLYAVGESAPAEEMARRIEQQNLMARINLPMGRVEIRTDDGGNSIETDIANLTFKRLLLLQFYGDPRFARSFRYDREDIPRARSNEQAAARLGLRAEIENPLTAKPVGMRDFLGWTLAQLRPLGEALGWWPDLQPLVEMSLGAPNTAEQLRGRLRRELGDAPEVPLNVLRQVALEREARVRTDVEGIAAGYLGLGPDAHRLSELIQHARDEAREHPDLPVRFRPASGVVIETAYADKTSEILDLARHLIRIPSVTASPNERLDEVHRAGTFVFDYLRQSGLEVRFFDGKYPAIYARFSGNPFPETVQEPLRDPILLAGHFDVVEPDPDDTQFTPRVEADYLWGRGAADMKTVVATYLVWMKDRVRHTTSLPSIELLLVGNEENGEAEAWGTPHVLEQLRRDAPPGSPYRHPALMIAGERTGERGDEPFGEICTENRGIMRFEIVVRGARGHSGAACASDLSELLVATRSALDDLFARHLTLKDADGWKSQARFPFITVGTPGIYNVTASEGSLGVEIRSIPQDNVHALRSAVERYCSENSLDVTFSVAENGVACSPDNPGLLALAEAVRRASGGEPRLGRKLPGTSARFAPGGQAVVWGQSGIGPHARDERHYIPSIDPYYRSLDELARLWC